MTFNAKFLPISEDVPSRDEAPIPINEKPTTSDSNKLKLIGGVVVPANNWDNRAKGGLYCFDGHIFRATKQKDVEHGKCNDRGISHGGSGVILNMQLKRGHPTPHPAVRQYSKHDQRAPLP
jgi:hypothetical protein